MTALPDVIVTRRLLLRQPSERDVPEIVRGLGNWDVAKWLGRVPHPYVAFHARQWLAFYRARRAAGCDMTLAITPRARPQQVIGVLGLHDIDQPSPDIGYWLAEPYWRRGYVTEAGRAMLEALWSIHPQARPVSCAMPENTGSARVLRKLGFVPHLPVKYRQNVARGHFVPTFDFTWKPDSPGSQRLDW